MNQNQDYSSFLQKSLDLKKMREERKKEVSRETLFKSSKRKYRQR